MLILSATTLSKENKPVLTNHTTDCDGFRESLDKTVLLNVSLKTVEQSNHEIEQFFVVLQKATWNNTKQIARKTVEINYFQEIRTLIKGKKKGEAAMAVKKSSNRQKEPKQIHATTKA